MTYFKWTFIITLLSVAAINLYVDPGYRWHRKPLEFDHNWEKSSFWKSPMNFDERPFRAAHLSLIKTPDVLLLGSSRVWLVTSEMFSPRLQVYNAGMSGGSVWDYMAVWQLLKEQKKTPGVVVLFFDNWVLNKNTFGKYRWITNYAPVSRFLTENGGFELRAKAFFEKLRGQFSEVEDLFNASVLKASLLELRERWSATKGVGAELAILPIEGRPPESDGWRSDGSRVYPLPYIHEKSLAEIRKLAGDPTVATLHAYLTNWEDDSSVGRAFEVLLQDMTQMGTRIYVIAPPFHAQSLELLRTRPEFAKVPLRLSQVTDAWRKSGARFDFCDATDPSTVHCSETEFIDSAHPLASCSDKILKGCFSTDAFWNQLLAKEHR